MDSMAAPFEPAKELQEKLAAIGDRGVRAIEADHLRGVREALDFLGLERRALACAEVPARAIGPHETAE